MNHDDELGGDVRAVRDRLGPANPVPSAAASPDQLAAGRAALETRRWQLERDRPGSGADIPARRSWLWPLGIAAAVVAVALTAVSLSFRDTGRTPAQAVLASYTATKDSGSARTAFTISGGGQVASGQGAGDFRTGDAAGTITLPLVGTVPVISAGGTLYVQLPEQFRQFSGGKPWASTSTVNVLQLGNVALGEIGLSQPFDPAEVLPYLRSVSGQVADVGHDTLRGTATTHYRASINLSRVADRAGAQAQPALWGAAAASRQPLPADLWVDDQGRLRKLTVTVPGATPLTATIELWDFGVRVDATPPPADQVSELRFFG